MKRIRIIILLIVGFIPTYSWAKDWEAAYYTNMDGLSNSSVNSIFLDSKHLLWIGTWDGLHSFNGKDFEVYKYDPNNRYSISNNIIEDIIEEDSDKLWIATNLGIDLFDKSKRIFRKFDFKHIGKNQQGHSSFKLAKGLDGSIFCVISKGAITYYHKKKKDFVVLDIPQLENLDIHFFEADSAGNLFLLDNQGQLHKVKVTKDVEGNISVSSCSLVRKNTLFSHIFHKSGNDLWLLDKENKLYLYNSINGITHYITHLTNNAAKHSDRIMDIKSVNGDTFIAYSLSGLYTLNTTDTGKTEMIPFDKIERQGVNSLYWDQQNGILWVGTDGKGLISLSQSSMNFHLMHNFDIHKSWNNPIRSFCEDKDGNFWVASKGNGIAVMSHNAKGISKVVNLLLRNQAVYSLINGIDDDILIGSDDFGVFVCKKNKEIYKIDLSAFIDSNSEFRSAYSMYLDKEKKILWLGTNGYGLIKIEFDYINNRYRAKAYKVYSEKDFSKISDAIYTVVPMDREHLWLATRGKGICVFNINTEEITIYDRNSNPALSDNDVLCLTKTDDGIVWAGTSYGLNRISNTAGKIQIDKYTEASGLPNNTIHGIVEDKSKTLWISTNNGISRFNLNKGEITNYRNRYNLQNNEFSDGAYFKSSEGYIFFGGINGFNYFKSEEIKERKFSPSIQITDFKLNSGNQSVLDRIKENNGNEIIELRHNENFFNINFVALDYINNANCEYSYILEGFSDAWVSEPNINRAIFTNVRPGKYIFRLRSTNGDKVWQDNEYILHIVIQDPWWHTWWAYLIYFALVVLIVYVVYSIIRKRLKLKQSLLLEKLEKKEQQQIYEAKLRFFTNIAHEFSTPLTLIYGPSQKLLDSVESESQKKYIRVIRSNAERMENLINELMDFRKAETGHQQLKFVNLNVTELIKCVTDSFIEIIGEKEIRLSLNIDSQSPIMWVTDYNCLEKILFNLISNAIKYVNDQGYIGLSVAVKNDQLLLNIENTGRGISEGQLKYVFNRFKILDNYEKQLSKGGVKRTGIGLALTKSLVELLKGKITVASVVNEKTVFSVTLPAINISTVQIQEETGTVKSSQGDSSNIIDNIKDDFLSKKANRKVTILVVDDELEIRNFLNEILSDRYKVVLAGSVSEAVEEVREAMPDLIISDILMEDKKGDVLLKELKKNKHTKHIPFVFLSSKTTIEAQIKGYSEGIDAFITKPFHPQYLLTVVDSILANHEHLKKHYTSNPFLSEELEDVNSDEKDFLYKVVQIIEENIDDEKLNSKLISDYLAISQMQLYRKLKDSISLTPSEFIRKVKLKYATKLLRTTEQTVLEIMYNSGFFSKSYFYREFQKEFGVSPKEYIKKVKDDTNNKY